MIVAVQWQMVCPDSAVIATRPARRAIQRHRSDRPCQTSSLATASVRRPMHPPAAARLVFIKTTATALASSRTDAVASTEPPLKPNQPSQRIRVPSVARGRLQPGMALTSPPLRAVLAFASANQQDARQSGCGASTCARCRSPRNRGSPSRLRYSRIPITAPFPEALHRVDEIRSGHDGEGEERPELHALSDRTRYDGHRRGNEHHLEEEVRQVGVVRTAPSLPITSLPPNCRQPLTCRSPSWKTPLAHSRRPDT